MSKPIMSHVRLHLKTITVPKTFINKNHYATATQSKPQQQIDLDIPPPPEPPSASSLATINNVKLDLDVKPEIIGGLIPWKLMPLQGKIICFVTWPIMYYLSYLHEMFPWWASISITTLTLRVLMTPLVINSVRTSTVYMNIMPKTTQLNKKMMEALQSSDTMEAQHYRMKLKALNKQHGVSEFQRLWPAFCQAPIFMSMYAILRTLSQNQESLKEGGILWFKDLSVMDPTFILPILTCSTLLLCIELGAETGELISNNSINIFSSFLCIYSQSSVHIFPNPCRWVECRFC